MKLTKRTIPTIESKRAKTRLCHCSRRWSRTMSVSQSNTISRSRKTEQLPCSETTTRTSSSISTHMDRAAAHQPPPTRVRPSNEATRRYPRLRQVQHQKRQSFASLFSSSMSTWAHRDPRGSLCGTVTLRRPSPTNSAPSTASKTSPCNNSYIAC